MRRSRSRTGDERGFTLVELIVVVTIIGLLAAAAVLAIPNARGGLQGEAERFAARAKTAQETALINARAMSLRLDSAGYAMARMQGGAWQDIASFAWESGTRPDLTGSAQARTVFDPTGVADPLEVTLRRGEERAQIVIGSNGEIEIRR